MVKRNKRTKDTLLLEYLKGFNENEEVSKVFQLLLKGLELFINILLQKISLVSLENLDTRFHHPVRPSSR